MSFRKLSLWDLAVALIGIFFVLIKIPYLNLPYFWDEAWVYAPAVFDMYENGPSLSPDSIAPELSRGHPILFHFLAVCWMTIFGTSFTVVHLFPLFQSVLLLWTIYKLGSSLANEQVGFWAAALLALQPILIQQSGFLLPEVQLALFATLTILFYLKRKPWWYIASASALLLTKETGILVIAVIGILELVDFLRERTLTRKRIWEFVSVGIPVGLAAVYFGVQYLQFGWFMFPEHVNMFELEPSVWEWKRGLVYSSVFLEQQRPIIISTVLASAVFAWVDGPKLLRILFLFCLLTLATMTGLDSWLPGWYYYYVFPVIIAISLIWTGVFLFKQGTKNHLFLPYTGLICTVMLLFTSTHFVIGRYLLYLLPLVLLSLVLVAHLVLKRSKWLFHVLMLCLGLMFYHLANKADARMSTSNNLKYVDQIMVLQDGIGYLRENGLFEECIVGSFLVQEALGHPVQGYVVENFKPRCLLSSIPDDVDNVMLLSFETNAELEAVKTDQDFEMTFESRHGDFRSWVYKRK
ncbi:MAG: glycosyltransferase family 39 protein [Flavobacteriales bacterium]|nr:glycosyltransferase family 39 protein [Flavobacteriales bacterium]